MLIGPVSLLLLAQAAAPAVELAAMLEGAWDNAAQIETEADPARPHLFVVHHGFESEAAPGALVYAQLNVGGPDGDIYRQRVYAFTEGEGGGVAMAAYEFAEAEDFADAHAAPEALASLTAEDLIRFDPGCDFAWVKQEETWTGSIEDGACVRTSRRSGRDMVILGEFSISETRFTHSEAGRFADDGQWVFQPPNGVPNLYDPFPQP
ncbi:MAG: chromophore lyase CpcT/CpeT [Pseudomonadota bacterium]